MQYEYLPHRAMIKIGSSLLATQLCSYVWILQNTLFYCVIYSERICRGAHDDGDILKMCSYYWYYLGLNTYVRGFQVPCLSRVSGKMNHLIWLLFNFTVTTLGLKWQKNTNVLKYRHAHTQAHSKTVSDGQCSLNHELYQDDRPGWLTGISFVLSVCCNSGSKVLRSLTNC